MILNLDRFQFLYLLKAAIAPVGAAGSEWAALWQVYQVRLAGPGGERTVTTAKDGSYRLTDLPAGVYRVSVDGTQEGNMM